MSFSKFLRELNDDKKEGYLLKSLFFSLVSGLAVFFLIYFIFLRGGQFGTGIIFSLLAVISYSILMPSLLQVKAYGQLPCMSGMMVGMTFGMIAGFLPGFYVASSNGMFWGSVFGMTVGILFGIINGRCCGVMGVMEGVMAGFMGGLMGAMTAIMLLNDHLAAMGVIVLVIGSAIMLGLSYMLYHEGKSSKRIGSVGYTSIILWSILLSAITVLFISMGPRGGIFA